MGPEGRLLPVVALLVAAIALHTATLYPWLSAAEMAAQAALRVALTTLPLGFGCALRAGAGPTIRWVSGAVAALLLPYVLYNVFQVRHVAEMFRLEGSEPFAPAHAAEAWKLLPTLLYSALSLPIFFRCLDDLTERAPWPGALRLALIALSAMGATFGLFTRINLWELTRWDGAGGVSEGVAFWANALALAGTAALLDLLWRRRP